MPDSVFTERELAYLTGGGTTITVDEVLRAIAGAPA
jgi:hypothetical protein